MPSQEKLLSRNQFMQSNDGVENKKTLVYVQGNTLVCKQPKLMFHRPSPPARVMGTDMSDKSRFNLLKTIHSINWEDQGKCLFCTLTYPEKGYYSTCREAGQHRSSFWRSIEDYLGKKVPAFWRIEWEDRKSGVNLGYLWPHYHLLIVGVRYIPHTLVQDKWAAIHGVSHIHTYIDDCHSREDAALYAAKYAAKTGVCSLASAPNHNTRPRGRSWGILRKNILPVEQPRGYVIDDPRLMQEMAVMVPRLHDYAAQYGNVTFTLLGKSAKAMEGILKERGIDAIPLRG